MLFELDEEKETNDVSAVFDADSGTLDAKDEEKDVAVTTSESKPGQVDDTGDAGSAGTAATATTTITTTTAGATDEAQTSNNNDVAVTTQPPVAGTGQTSLELVTPELGVKIDAAEADTEIGDNLDDDEKNMVAQELALEKKLEEEEENEKEPTTLIETLYSTVVETLSTADFVTDFLVLRLFAKTEQQWWSSWMVLLMYVFVCLFLICFLLFLICCFFSITIIFFLGWRLIWCHFQFWVLCLSNAYLDLWHECSWKEYQNVV